MLGLSNQRYTSACICGVNICRNSWYSVQNFFFFWFIITVVVIIIIIINIIDNIIILPDSPCAMSEHAVRKQSKIQELRRFSSTHIVLFFVFFQAR